MFGRHEQRPAPSQVATTQERTEYKPNFKLTVHHRGRYDDYIEEYYCNKYECDEGSGVVRLFDDVHGIPTVILSPYNYVDIKVERL